MTEEFLTDARRALRNHAAFEPIDGDGFAVTTTPFEARVTIGPGNDEVRYRVEVRVPVIDAVVEGETVAPVVVDGWFETFERRVEAIGDGVTRVDLDSPDVERDRASHDAVVEFGFRTAIPGRGAEDAKALVDFVEGTYVQGVIPGYDYDEPVADLVRRGRERSQGHTPG